MVLSILKDAAIVYLYKRNGNRQLFDCHRGISLLKIAGKIFAASSSTASTDTLSEDLRRKPNMASDDTAQSPI
ncbi:hypothetical protein SprV_0401627800 [Sparganum proliferum]